MLEPGDPNVNPNSQIYACGLAIDDENKLLYVSQFNGQYSSIIEVYSIDDFEQNFFPTVRTIDLNDAFDGDNYYAVDIDIDIANQWLYAGGYTGHRNLIRFDLEEDDPNATGYGGYIKEIVPWEKNYDDRGVIGLAVSPGTRFVYMTTYNNLLEAWDTNLPLVGGWYQIDAEPIDAGAGVCVADVDYVPPFSVSKIADVNDVVGCISSEAGEEITYTISYAYNWTEPGDPNLYDFTQIYIEDHLPNEVDFVSADPTPTDPNLGYYDSSNHSYVWIITPENYGSPNSIDITVEINTKVTPGEPIENAVVEIVSDINEQTYTETAEIETTICECGDSGKIIFVDEDAIEGDDNGTSWPDAYVDLQSALKEAFPCDQIWVADGTYIPESEPNKLASFKLVNAVGVYGGFAGEPNEETKRYERNWAENETVLSGYIDPNEVNFVVTADEDIRWAILDGFTIEGGLLAGILCQGGSVHIEHNKITDNGIGILCDGTLSAIIRNNWIYENTIGMSFEDLQHTAIVRNNTIVDNDPAGVYCVSDINNQTYTQTAETGDAHITGRPEKKVDFVGFFV